eukprot:Gb_06245 [translate_table: standard]
MAALQLNSALHYGLGKLSPINESKGTKYPTKQMPFRGARAVSSALSSAENAAPTPLESSVPEGPPRIDFDFIGNEPLPDGSPEVVKVSTTGGQKLRNIILDNRLDLYGPYGVGIGVYIVCLGDDFKATEFVMEMPPAYQLGINISSA